MKLVFPNGEHPQALLAAGLNRIGAAHGNTIVLDAPDMPAHAADVHLVGTSMHLVPRTIGAVWVNDAAVGELIALRNGDRVRFGSVDARIAVLPQPAGASRADVDAAPLDDAATRMMSAMPRYILRGLNGADFGRSYAIATTMTIGRAQDCDIRLDLPEISRRHVRLQAMPDGVAIEDLGSSNGVWINDARVQRGLLHVGDELRLDSARYVLTAPGQDLSTVPQRMTPSLTTRDDAMAAQPWAMFALVGLAVLIGLAMVLVVTL